MARKSPTMAIANVEKDYTHYSNDPFQKQFFNATCLLVHQISEVSLIAFVFPQ